MSVLRKKPPLEAKEEADFLKVLKQSGVDFKTRKMNGLGYRSWPDRLVLGPERFFILIELKRKEIGKLSPGQEELFKDLSFMGHEVHVFDDGKAAAQFVLEQYLEFRRG